LGGDPYGGSCALDQFFIWRPFAQSKNNATAITNLHHIGASTHPGPRTWRRLRLPSGKEVGRMNEIKTPPSGKAEPLQRLGEIGLSNFAPYLMNRIMGRYNADLRQEMTGLGLTTPKMRALAVLSVIDDLPISELAVYAVVEQSTLSRSLEQLASDGLVRRDPGSERQQGHAHRHHRDRPCRPRSALAVNGARLHPDVSRTFRTRSARLFVTDACRKCSSNIRKHDF
jgi:DNA-binding transcriptional ArsR family regulator